MNLDKDSVKYLHDHPCFTCRYSHIDPYDWGLRCCNGDSEHCTEYCPDKPCEHFEVLQDGDSPRLKAIRDLSQGGMNSYFFRKCDLSKEELELLKYGKE
jgi:hypothetical protein